MGIRALWQRFCDDFRILWDWLTGKEEPPEEPTLGEWLAVTVPRVPVPNIDWFVWECLRYQEAPAFWHDHWRYEGTEYAYPEPSEEQRRRVWNASLLKAIQAHGEATVRAHGLKLAPLVYGQPEAEAVYMRQPDPWAWAMQQTVH